MAGKTIAIIEDDDDVRDFLKFVLGQAGYSPQLYARSQEVVKVMPYDPPDLVIMDVHMPGIDGLGLLKIVKADDKLKNVPVIMYSGASSDSNYAVEALRLGADDFIRKPFERDILLARIEALLRRLNWQQDVLGGKDLRSGPILVKTGEHRAWISNAEVRLAPMEFELLVCLLENQGKVLTRGYLQNYVWKDSAPSPGRTVDKHIENLRKKMGEAAALIRTIHGVGYRFDLKDSVR